MFRSSIYDCDNSAGIIDFPDLKHDIARAGISIYGMYPSDDVDQNAVSLRPALRLVSHVSFVKEVGKGTSISYGGTYITEKDEDCNHSGGIWRWVSQITVK